MAPTTATLLHIGGLLGDAKEPREGFGLLEAAGALLDVTRADELVDDVEGDHDQNGGHPGL